MSTEAISTKTQFSITLISRPGSMATLIDQLYKARCDIAAMTVVDTSDHGTIRLVFNSDEATARRVLQECNLGGVAESEVLAVTMSNRPGAIADVAGKLAAAKVNIVYAYVTSGAPGGKTTGIFRTSDNKKAAKILQNGTPPARKKDPTAIVKRSAVRAGRR